MRQLVKYQQSETNGNIQCISMKKSVTFSRRRGMDINLRLSSFFVKTVKKSVEKQFIFCRKICMGKGKCTK
jgi:hypothetical protein